MARRQDTYGDIILPDPAPGMIDCQRETSAKLLADEMSHNLGEYKPHDDAQEAIEYIESHGYRYDRDSRCWRPTHA